MFALHWPNGKRECFIYTDAISRRRMLSVRPHFLAEIRQEFIMSEFLSVVAGCSKIGCIERIDPNVFCSHPVPAFWYMITDQGDHGHFVAQYPQPIYTFPEVYFDQAKILINFLMKRETAQFRFEANEQTQVVRAVLQIPIDDVVSPIDIQKAAQTFVDEWATLLPFLDRIALKREKAEAVVNDALEAFEWLDESYGRPKIMSSSVPSTES
jgi:hypothetical protein